VRTLYRDAGPDIGLDKQSELRLRLENESRIIALPGKEETVRGFSAVDLVIADEAARVPDSAYVATRPMLAVSGGRFVGLSTPAGQRGWFYTAWETQPDWEKVKVTGYDCPRMSDEFLEQERREMGDWQFRNEYLCEFQDTENQLFRTEDIESALTEEESALFGGESTQFLTDEDPLFADG